MLLSTDNKIVCMYGKPPDD